MDQVTNAPPTPSSSPLQPPVEDTFSESEPSTSTQENSKIREPSQVSRAESESEMILILQYDSKHCLPKNDSTITFKEDGHEMELSSHHLHHIQRSKILQTNLWYVQAYTVYNNWDKCSNHSNL